MAAGKTNVFGGGLEIKGIAGGFTGASATTTKMSKTGKGILTGITALGIGTLNTDIYADGILVISINLSTDRYIPEFLIPFNSSLEIRTDSTSPFLASFCLGSFDLTKGTPNVTKYNSTGVYNTNNLVQSVTGEGFVIGTNAVISSTGGARLMIDGSEVLNVYNISNTRECSVHLLRFNTGFEFHSAQSFSNVNQVIYLLE